MRSRPWLFLSLAALCSTGVSCSSSSGDSDGAAGTSGASGSSAGTSAGGTSAGTGTEGGRAGDAGSPQAGAGQAGSDAGGQAGSEPAGGQAGSEPAGGQAGSEPAGGQAGSEPAGGQAGAAAGGSGGSGQSGAGSSGSSGQSGAGSSGSSGQSGAAGSGFTPPPGGGLDPAPFGGTRPVRLFVPEGYQGNQPAPLVVLLHGIGASGLQQEGYLGLTAVAAEKGLLYAYPDGTINGQGQRFWNATDACCDFGITKVDDVGYLAGLVDEIKGRYAVDPKRVYFVGHSNGGFMAHRMACERADLIAGIASLAGATWATPSKCQPSAPVSVVQAHGTADQTVLYDGGVFFGIPYPSAPTTVSSWATLDGCTVGPDTVATLDLDATLPGAETSVRRSGASCAAQTAVELWTIQDGVHIPAVSGTFARAAIDFLLAHPRP